MNESTKNEFRINDLYDALHDVEWSFCSIYDGGAGVGLLGHVIPFDDAVVFADVVLGRKAVVPASSSPRPARRSVASP